MLLTFIFSIFFAIFPFLNVTNFLYGASSGRSILLIITSSILGLILVWRWLKNKNPLTIPRSPIFLVLFLSFIANSVSSLLGLNPSVSFWSVATRTTGLWYFLNLGLFIYLLREILLDSRRQRKLILVVVLSTAVYSFLAILSPEGLGWIFTTYSGDGFTFGNSTFAGMYLFGAFLLSIYYLYQTEQKKWWLYLLPLVLLANPYFLSRNVWLGDFAHGLVGEARASAYVLALSIVGLLAVWLISKVKSPKNKSISAYSLFGLGSLGILLAVYSLLSSGGFVRQLYLEQATAVRPLAWEMSVSAISEHPFFGWGTDNFERMFESNYDNRILQDEYGNEAWLDRAHNVVLDQLVDGGIVGLIFYVLIYLTIIWSLIYSALYSPDRSDRILASILALYFPLHFLELQTAFDTSISYPMLAFMIVSAAVLFERTRRAENKNTEWFIHGWAKYGLAVLLLLGILSSIGWGLFPFLRAQTANSNLRLVDSSAKRIPLYPALFSSSIDPHAFTWRISADFQRGITAAPEILGSPTDVQDLKQEIVLIEEEYRDYLRENPEHYRARLNLADVLIFQNLFGVNKLEEAQNVLDEAIERLPQIPQAYWMKAVAYIYLGNFDLAREFAQKGYDLNPKIRESGEVVNYVENSIKTFPEIDLYFFRYI